MHREVPVSATHQMYLKVLHRLSRTEPVGRVRDILSGLGLGLQVESGPTPTLIATIRTPRGTVELC